MNYNEAKTFLENAKIDQCETFFVENNYELENAYCKLMRGDLEEAKKIFFSIRDQDFRADWAYLLIQFIKNNIQFMPSYLQIRNFLEIDIALLIKAGQPEFVENIINASDIFFEINQESYKFIARVLMNYKYPTLAKIYLNKGVEKCYNDPELHFLYGCYHLLYKNILLAKNSFETTLEVLPNYYPAKMMLAKLK